jgi:branched-chain amino acid transport system substrate-binding protein
VQKIGTDDPDKVVAALEGTKFSDMFARNAEWRKQDHLVVKTTYVGQIKQPSEIQGQDYLKIIDTVPGDVAYPPASASTCKHDW